MAKHTKAQAARALGISRTTLYCLIEQGALSPAPDGLIDDTEMVRAAPHVDAIKERIATSSNSDQERHGTSGYSPRVDTQPQEDEQHVTPVNSIQERHDTPVTGRDWTDDTTRYRAHLEGEVDTLRAQVNRLQAQVETLQDELCEGRIARDRAQEDASTERARYVQMLQEFYQRYDRLLDAPRPVPTPRPTADSRPMPTGAAARGAMRRRLLALLQEHPEGLTPAQIRTHLGVEKRLAHTCIAMARDGLLRRIETGRYGGV
jgi:hypothetical protein